MTKGPDNSSNVAEHSRTRRRTRQTRNRLVQAALSVFGEKGVEAATIEDITEKADLGKGTFYRHFKSKEDLIVAMITKSVGQLMQEIRKSLTGRQGLQEVLTALLQAHTRFFTERREEFLLLFQGRLLLSPEHQGPRGLEKPFIEYLQEIEKCVAPFMAPPADASNVRRAACMLAGFVSGFLSFALIGLGEHGIDGSIEPLQRAFVAGCSALLTTDSPMAVAASAPPDRSQQIVGAMKHNGHDNRY